MNTYPQQLVAELSEHLDSKIITFFSDTKENYNYPVASVNDLVEYTLESSFGGKTSQEDLRKVYDYALSNRRKRKIRWMEKLLTDLQTYSTEDLRHPFANLVSQKRILTKSQWGLFYGDKSLEDVIQEKIAEAKEWQKQSDSYFISFPAIHSHTAHRIFTSMVSDVMFCIYQYIYERYEGSIENYFLSFPKDLIGFPLFAPKKVRLTPSVEGETVSEKYDYGEGILETSSNIYTVNDQLNSMDQNDLKIFYTSLQNLDVDFYTTRQARVKKRVLVKQLNPRPSKKHYDMMENHCHMLSKYNFAVTVNGKKKISFNLIDSVDTSDPDEVVFTYGNLLYDSIIANDITNIKTSNMQLLEQNLSTILYQSLFRERIILSTKNAGGTADLIADYPYTFFSRSVRFPNQSRKKNMDLIEESLNEFVQKKIVVKSYEKLSATQFRIHFYPLSSEEQADLNYNRFKNLAAFAPTDETEE